METQERTKNHTLLLAAGYVLLVLCLAGLAVISARNYLLFHSIVEIFSVVIGFAIFFLSWNARRFMAGSYFPFLGLAYLCVGGLDFLHTLAYQGMGVFPDYPVDLATQLWVAARYVECLCLAGAPLLAARRVSLPPLGAALGAVFAFILGAIFLWRIFPVCYVPDTGLTPFKIISEYVICAILAGAIVMHSRRRAHFSPHVLTLLYASMAVAIASEFAFTLYSTPFDVHNIAGHILKVVSFYLLYRAFVVTGLDEPYAFMFRELKANERRLVESEYTARTLLNAPRDAAALLDRQGRVLDINRHALDMLRTRVRDFQGRYFWDAFSGSFIPLLRQQFEACRDTGTPIMFDEQINTRWYHFQLHPVHDAEGGIGKLALLVRDVTHRKQYEDALRRNRDDLERLVRDRTTDLVNANRQLRDMSHQVLTLQEQERTRLARDLHDQLGQTITALAIEIDAIENSGLCGAEQYQVLRSMAEELSNETRRICAGLRPSVLDRWGLKAAMETFVDEFRDRARMRVDLDIEAPGRKPAELVEISLFRIMQEALNNAAKYACTDSAAVSLRQESGDLVLTIHDNGRGFDIVMPGARGFGITGMKERASLCGGVLDVVSAPGQGTTIIARLPLAGPPAHE